MGVLVIVAVVVAASVVVVVAFVPFFVAVISFRYEKRAKANIFFSSLKKSSFYD